MLLVCHYAYVKGDSLFPTHYSELLVELLKTNKQKVVDIKKYIYNSTQVYQPVYTAPSLTGLLQ